MFIAPNVSLENFNTTFLPFLQCVEEATGSLIQPETTPFNSFYELYSASFVNTSGQTGAPAEVASRLLPRSLAETDPAKAARIMLSLVGGVGLE